MERNVWFYRGLDFLDTGSHILVRILDTKMSTLLHDNFTLFSLQMQVTECKSKVNGLRRYTFQAETNFRILNLI